MSQAFIREIECELSLNERLRHAWRSGMGFHVTLALFDLSIKGRDRFNFLRRPSGFRHRTALCGFQRDEAPLYVGVFCSPEEHRKLAHDKETMGCGKNLRPVASDSYEQFGYFGHVSRIQVRLRLVPKKDGLFRQRAVGKQVCHCS